MRLPLGLAVAEECVECDGGIKLAQRTAQAHSTPHEHELGSVDVIGHSELVKHVVIDIGIGLEISCRYTTHTMGAAAAADGRRSLACASTSGCRRVQRARSRLRQFERAIEHRERWELAPLEHLTSCGIDRAVIRVCQCPAKHPSETHPCPHAHVTSHDLT